MNLKVVLLLSLAIHYSFAVTRLIKLDTNQYPNAKCTDGTPYGYYYQEGGGGACLGTTESLIGEACLQRRNTNLGSSNKWKDTFELNFPEDQMEPRLTEWTKVYFPYCDGFAYQGTRTGVWTYKGVDFYFRGADNVKATITDIKLKFASSDIQVTDIFVAGSSAGGLGTFYYADFIKEQFNHINNLNYWAAPDSGFFINYPSTESENSLLGASTRIAIGKILNRSDTDIYPQNCDVINDAENAYKCMLPEYIAPKIKANLYIIQSNYDSFILGRLYQVKCVQNKSLSSCNNKELAQIQAIKETIVKKLEDLIKIKSNSGVWSISCVFHVALKNKSIYGSPNYEIPEMSGNTAIKSLKTWMGNPIKVRQSYIDSVNYPNNTLCSDNRTQEGIQTSISPLHVVVYSLIISLIAFTM